MSFEISEDANHMRFILKQTTRRQIAIYGAAVLLIAVLSLMLWETRRELDSTKRMLGAVRTDVQRAIDLCPDIIYELSPPNIFGDPI